MQNVVYLKSVDSRPDDLISIRNFCIKQGYKYGYVYKYSVRADKEGFKGVKPYWRGGWAISEKEFLAFDRGRYGRNK